MRTDYTALTCVRKFNKNSPTHGCKKEWYHENLGLKKYTHIKQIRHFTKHKRIHTNYCKTAKIHTVVEVIQNRNGFVHAR